jgi:hypothetical protein
MLNFELLIIIYILLSFLIFYYILDKKEGLACTSTPFYNNDDVSKKRKLSSRSTIGDSPEFTDASQNEMFNSFIKIMDDIELSMRDIKSKIPINFALGVVNNVDNTPNMSIYGSLPNVFLNFSIQNPPPGPQGNVGKAAPMYGPTGDVGPIGKVGETGYWGTTKNTIF